jgi:hypothetical protein
MFPFPCSVYKLSAKESETMTVNAFASCCVIIQISKTNLQSVITSTVRGEGAGVNFNFNSKLILHNVEKAMLRFVHILTDIIS